MHVNEGSADKCHDDCDDEYGDSDLSIIIEYFFSLYLLVIYTKILFCKPYNTHVYDKHIFNYYYLLLVTIY